MTVRIRGVWLAALLLLTGIAAPAAAQKVGFVDTRKILAEMPGRAQAEQRMRASLDSLTRRQQLMVDSLSAMMSAFEADSASLTQEQKVARFTALQMYDARYRDTLEVLEAEAQEAQATSMQPLVDRVRLALEDLRQAEGFAMIFDIGAQVNPIVAMDRNLDLSDRVLARLRAQGPATPPTAAPTTPPAGPVSQPAGVRRP